MRLRTDSFHIAGWKRAHGLRGCECTPEMLAAALIPRDEREVGMTSHVAHDPAYADIPPAEPGDVWRVAGWLSTPADSTEVMGYALTCPEPGCRQGVHAWWHAADCAANGSPKATCKHGRASCWQWTGTPEAGDLSASPSLWVKRELGGCGWHGFLRSGAMVPA